MKSANKSKEVYRRLRALPWGQLWNDEVTRFNHAPTRERFENVTIIRAVATVFFESGPASQRDEVTQWLRKLLKDPEEKIRRYAITTLPKFGAGAGDEAELLALLQKGAGEREAKFVGKTLDKIGGAATLEALRVSGGLPLQTEQKVRASVARSQARTSILMDRPVADFCGLRIHLRGRAGLERFVRDEVEEQAKFTVLDVRPGLVAITAKTAFTLADIFALRCFGTVGFVLGEVKSANATASIEALASIIASSLSQRLLGALTQGAIRYRLDFVEKGHQRAAVREIANRAYALCPHLLNDAREAPWAVDIHPAAHSESVELRPRLSPDPRHAYRLDDVPAASHPPLAACMARLAGRQENERIWDPFCGSGLELIERARRGGVRRVFGSDLSEEAIAVAEQNFFAAKTGVAAVQFRRCDFRDFTKLENITPHSLSLIISNPPLGRRVPIRNLRSFFEDIFAVAADVLAPGGRLVFTNPLLMESPEPSLKMKFRQVVDLGGFQCRLELYQKLAR